MTNDVEQKVSGESKSEDGSLQPTFDEVLASPTSKLASEQISAFSKEQEAQLEKIVERAVQSTKDKRFSTLEKSESTLKEVLTQLKAANIPIPPEMERDMQLKEYVDQRIASVAPVSDKSMSDAGANQQGNLNVIDELKNLKLDTNDPDVIKLASGHYRSPDHFLAEARGLAIRKSSSLPADTVVTAPVGGVTPTKMSDSEKDAKYTKLNALYKTPTQSAAEIKKLELELGI